jgi:hypothetical protein
MRYPGREMKFSFRMLIPEPLLKWLAKADNFIFYRKFEMSYQIYSWSKFAVNSGG